MTAGLRWYLTSMAQMASQLPMLLLRFGSDLWSVQRRFADVPATP